MPSLLDRVTTYNNKANKEKALLQEAIDLQLPLKQELNKLLITALSEAQKDYTEDHKKKFLYKLFPYDLTLTINTVINPNHIRYVIPRITTVNKAIVDHKYDIHNYLPKEAYDLCNQLDIIYDSYIECKRELQKED